MLHVMAAAALLCAAAPAVRAHHSFAVYDNSKVVILKGTVKTFQWTNPHCVIWLVVEAPGGGAAEEWSIETTSPGVLTRSGWTRHSVNAGDRVSIEYHPLRDGSHGGGLVSVTLQSSGQVLKPNFGAQEKPGIE